MTDVQNLPEHYLGLRSWAQGMLPLVAATELLIRSGFATPNRPWVHWDALAERPWVNFGSVPELIGGLSGGEQRVLRIAASLAGDEPIILGDEISGLDREMLDLVLAAVSHTGGCGPRRDVLCGRATTE